MVGARRALISTSDKTGIEALAARLIDAAYVTGAPEILGGRVKTLHPRIHGGVLARLDSESDREDLEREGISPIELVAVNLYPFRETVARGAKLPEVIENIDIGGPTLIRAAAKNFEHVTVVVDPSDYDQVGAAMAEGGLDRGARYRLACKAFAHTCAYDAAIVGHLSGFEEPGEAASAHPRYHAGIYEKAQELRYGENPHQKAAFYLEEGLAGEPLISQAVQIQGKELSFNNYLDADAALELVKEFDETAAVVIKHTNPCGAATDPILAQAYRKARAGDEISAFGGVVALRREVDEDTARALAETFLEIVVAPAFSDEALSVLGAKKNLRLLAVASLDRPRADWRAPGKDLVKVGGGLLVQDMDQALFGDEEPKVVTSRSPTDEEWKALRFAWRIVKHVKSNAIVYAKGDQLVGVGAGQMSRVDSCKIGVQRAALPIRGCVMASDAFFPFRDGLDVGAEAGVTAVIQPGGSKRDAEVVEAANEKDIAMVFTGMRHFRH
ncbi:MAG: bifunctional phosphoribosylaminoimidazolecarboxamide formyltransferase/IMP cyclohydrolase [Myxococcota bacterium]